MVVVGGPMGVFRVMDGPLNLPLAYLIELAFVSKYFVPRQGLLCSLRVTRKKHLDR